jgi:hypothetical protein
VRAAATLRRDDGVGVLACLDLEGDWIGWTDSAGGTADMAGGTADMAVPFLPSGLAARGVER